MELPIDCPIPGDFLIRLDMPHAGRDSWVYVNEKNLEQRLEQVQRGEYGLAAPVPGYATKTPPSFQTEMLEELLAEEKISLHMFRWRHHAALDSPGGLHLVGLTPIDIETWCEEDDLVTRFKLRKGAYATVVMRELMKNHPVNRI